MTTVRPYAPALSTASALEELRAGRGSQFRPEVVDAFEAIVAALPPAPPAPATAPLRSVAAAG
jgi:HD-GYP domain-containing protein (c-di-GMP phosphodiesterase class II)